MTLFSGKATLKIDGILIGNVVFMKTLAAVQVELQRDELNIRAVNRLVRSKNFEQAYEQADENSKNLVIKIIDLFDSKKVRLWIVHELRDSPEHLNHAELVDLAKHENIRYYSKLSKSQLLSELKNKGVI